MRAIKLLYLFCFSAFACQGVLREQPSGIEANRPATRSVLQVDVPYPTADKPQSKIWYMDGDWWALLPRSNSPSLWQRTENGWVEHKEIGKSLAGIPGRADVWANGNEVTAVSVGNRELTVFRLTGAKNESGYKWNTRILATLKPPPGEAEIETATIAQDSTGRWWVAADSGDRICVWSASSPSDNWSGAFTLARGIHQDDICAVAVIPGGVGVIWSDQNQDAVSMRVHHNGTPESLWSDPVIIEKGNNTADDHLNTALSADGTLWVATKNSVDLEGKPQFVLRVRSPKGEWNNFVYARLERGKSPSRPIIVATEDPRILLSAHTCYNTKNPYLGEVVLGLVDTTDADILTNVATIISPDTTGWVGVNRINDVTGPKSPFRLNTTWILLASDKDGRVYESDLNQQIKILIEK